MSMKKVSLDTWIQLLGMLSVLAGLLFVGLEMRQSRRIAIRAQQQTRAQMGMESAFHWSDNEMDTSAIFRANARLSSFLVGLREGVLGAGCLGVIASPLTLQCNPVSRDPSPVKTISPFGSTHPPGYLHLHSKVPLHRYAYCL